MRSLHIIGSRQSGGAERFYVRLLHALARHGHDVMAVLPPNSVLCPMLEGVVPVHGVRMRSVFDVLAKSRINAAIRSFEPAVVQTYMGRATRLTHIKRRGRGSQSTPVHVARLGGYYDVKGYGHADAWVANARGIRNYLIDEGLPGERVYYIGNFVDPPIGRNQQRSDQLREELGLSEADWMITCLGRLHRNKAFDVMLDAFAKLPERIGERTARLVIIGDGPERRALEEQAQALRLTQRIQFTGWCDQPEPYLSASDLFVCPSRHEPLGNVVLEAWNESVSVLATRTGGLAELVQDGVNGRLVDCEDPDQLAGVVLELLDSPPAMRDALVAGAMHTLHTQHSEEAVVAAYARMYSELTGSAR